MAASIYSYNSDNRSFKVILLLSLGIHLLLTIGIYTFSHFNPAHLLTGPVYTVHLTDMPSRGVVDASAHAPLTAGTISIPNPKPAPLLPHKEIKVPKIKPIENVLPNISLWREDEDGNNLCVFSKITVYTL